MWRSPVGHDRAAKAPYPRRQCIDQQRCDSSAARRCRRARAATVVSTVFAGTLRRHAEGANLMPETTRKSFHEELAEVQQMIQRLGALACETIPRGTQILLANDLDGAQRLIQDDDEVDVLSLQVEEQCYQLLALQGPVASDLRAITTAIHLNHELERSADLMANVAKGARRIYGAVLSPRVRGLIEQMSEESLKLLRLAIEAYVDRSGSLAAALDDLDDRLDDLHQEYIQAIFESHQAEGLDLQVGVQLALIGRYYERIGDHAVNIGDRVQYLVTGWLPEHEGAVRAQARAAGAPSSDGAAASSEEKDDDGGGAGTA